MNRIFTMANTRVSIGFCDVELHVCLLPLPLQNRKGENPYYMHAPAYLLATFVFISMNVQLKCKYGNNSHCYSA